MNDDTISYAPPTSVKRHQPASPRTGTRAAGTWSGSAASWVRSGCDALSLSGRRDAALHSFADYLRQTCDPDEIQTTLARMAHTLSGAVRVELHRSDAPGRISRRVACWPETDAEPAEGAPAPLCLPLSLGGRNWGMLRLWAAPRQRWSPRLMRGLTTLGVLAAAAERAVRASRGAGTATPYDAATGLYNEPFLTSLLTHAMAQTRRRREPLALLCVGLDTSAGAGAWLSPDLSDNALQRVSQTISSTLRSSDIVARRNDDRLVVVLPAADTDDARTVAEALRRAIYEAGLISPTSAPMTASVGVAGYPEHSDDAETLQVMAANALGHAQKLGGNRVAVAAPPAKVTALRIAAMAV